MSVADIAYDRQTIFCRMPELVNLDDLDVLAAKTVAIPGCGGVGFTHAECLARMGVGRVKISDFDRFGPENVSRQFGATVTTMGRKKVEVLAERLEAVNPSLAVETSEGVSEDTVGCFLAGVDVVCDSLDFFAMKTRRMLHREAHKRGIPLVMTAPSSYGATLHVFDNSGLSLDEFFDLSDARSDEENLRNFTVGIDPARLSRHYHRSPALGPGKRGAVSAGCLLATSLTSTVVVRRLLGQSVYFKPVPYIYALDLVLGRFVELHIPRGVRSIKARPKDYMAGAGAAPRRRRFRWALGTVRHEQLHRWPVPRGEG